MVFLSLGWASLAQEQSSVAKHRHTNARDMILNGMITILLDVVGNYLVGMDVLTFKWIDTLKSLGVPPKNSSMYRKTHIFDGFAHLQVHSFVVGFEFQFWKLQITSVNIVILVQ